MPTLDEWEAGLTRLRSVLVDSSNQLANQINNLPGSRSFHNQPKVATGLLSFNVPRQILVTPFDLLRALGETTTPNIPSLVDISSMWAQLRYIWAFNPTDPEESLLRLSDEVQNIDFHQKSLLSDEIGVGIAALIVETQLNGHNPIDVSLALNNQQILGFTRSQGYTTSPDYIFTADNNNFIIVECKGTMSGQNYAFKQLRRGLEQVSAINFPGNPAILSLVISLSLSTTETKVFIVDPPTSKGKDPRDILLNKNKEQFIKDIKQNQIKNLLLFSGSIESASKFMSEEEKKVLKPRSQRRKILQEKKRVDFLGTDYCGYDQEIKMFGGQERISVFSGISEDSLQFLEAENIDEVFSIGKQIYEHADEASRRQNGKMELNEEGTLYCSTTRYSRENNSLRVSSVGLDGTLLEISISE